MKTRERDITGVVLAGGRAVRMGGLDKAILEIGGMRIIDRLIRQLERITRDILIISNRGEHYGYDYPVYGDVLKDKGPIGGLHSGLVHARTDSAIVLGCDMPFVPAEMFLYLLGQRGESRITVPVHGGIREPLCAIYGKDILDDVGEYISTGRLKMAGMLDDLDAKHIEIGSNLPFYKENIFANINTREDFEYIEKSNDIT